MGNLVTVKNNYDNGVCSGFTIYTGTTYNGHPFTIPPSANSIGFHTLPHTFDIGFYSGPLYVFLEHCDNHISPPPNEDPKKQGGFQVVLIDVDCEVCPPNSDAIDCTMVVSFVEDSLTDCNFSVSFVEGSYSTPTGTPTSTETPTPTPTPTLPPGPTPTPTPSSTPGPTPTPTSTNVPPTPTPTPEATAETTEISAILLSNTTSAPNNANCDEGNDGLIENRVFVLYNTTWFTTNASGKNVVKSTFSLTDNEIIDGGDSSYTIHPDSIWSGGPSVFRYSSDGTYMIADSSTEGTEKLLFQKNGNYGTTNKCGGIGSV